MVCPIASGRRHAAADFDGRTGSETVGGNEIESVTLSLSAAPEKPVRKTIRKEGNPKSDEIKQQSTPSVMTCPRLRSP